jgi:hypothetical protein
LLILRVERGWNFFFLLLGFSYTVAEKVIFHYTEMPPIKRAKALAQAKYLFKDC